MLNNIELIKTAFNLTGLPSGDLPEVILCGRSNVGKSSFINTLFNKKNLAKTSSVPGKTRSLNYYLVDKRFYLVDLPGFGYAKVSKKEREYWNKMMEEYLTKRKTIVFAFHIIDSRHNPTELDIQLNDYLRIKDIPYIVILNKVDKLNQSELARSKKNVLSLFPELIAGENIIAFSSINKTGRKEVLSSLNLLFNK